MQCIECLNRNYHPNEKSIALCAASMSSSLSDTGSYHLTSSAIPT